MGDDTVKSQWRDFCAQVARQPGVYKFIGERDKVLYVGKAKDLRKRLGSWLLRAAMNRKHQALMSRLRRVETVTARNEVEALLLESNLIKEHKPRYNVLLKDSTSYPLIRMSVDHDFPGVYFHRGERRGDGLFGPYPDSRALRRLLKLIYKLFRLRQCSDAFYRARTRPCIQYQIGNCSAPCVGLVSKEAYRKMVARCRLFLRGKLKQLVAELDSEMRGHAARQNYEEAAKCRDRLEAVRLVNTEQAAVGSHENIDFVAVGSRTGGQAIAQVLSIRGGINLGVATKRLRGGLDEEPVDLCRLFVIQHYSKQPPPQRIITEHSISDSEAIGELLMRTHQGLGHAVKLSGAGRAAKYRSWLAMARANLEERLQELDMRATMYRRAFEALGGYLELGDSPRIDCMDVSHTMGQQTVCSSVSCDSGGRRKDLYRLYNLTLERPGDDLEAMTEALRRKLRKSSVERDGLPSVLLIDGAANQWMACHRVLAELDLLDKVHLLAISKHDNRKLGMEYLHFDDKRWLAVRSLAQPLFRCLLDLRNEAHRFAISAHRERRRKRTIHSRLDGIPSVGAKRKRALLNYFRDPAVIQNATIGELAKVPGISHGVAEQVYRHFHSEAV